MIFEFSLNNLSNKVNPIWRLKDENTQQKFITSPLMAISANFQNDENNNDDINAKKCGKYKCFKSLLTLKYLKK